MSKKRGLSLEEKREKMLEIFHESSDVFVLKDVEKLSMKKGIILQSVKDVLQSLVDDDMVHQERIGASNYFWSFPSEAAVKLETEQQKLTAQLADLKQQHAALRKQSEESKLGKEETEDRVQKLGKLAESETKLKALQQELALYAESDPDKLEAMRNASDIAKACANRWLDNTYSLQSWCKKRFSGMDDQLNTFFQQNGLTDEVDYLE